MVLILQVRRIPGNTKKCVRGACHAENDKILCCGVKNSL